nr:hypothetical protein [Tanacetum cinerariifolium]
MQVDCHLDKSQCAESKDDKARMQNVPYASAVGSIIVAIVWKSFKQSTTAQQAAEAEYIATGEAAKEAVWIRKFVDELGVVPSNNYPIEMNCDNTAAISIAKEPGIMKGARHFQIKFHYVRECVETGKIEMVKQSETVDVPLERLRRGSRRIICGRVFIGKVPSSKEEDTMMRNHEEKTVVIRVKGRVEMRFYKHT